MFAVSTLQNFCSIPPAKCLQHPPCKIFAASTLQNNALWNVCSIHLDNCLQHQACIKKIPSSKWLQNPPCKKFVASTLKKIPPFKKIATSTTSQNVCSLHPAKYLKPAPNNMLAASIPAVLSKLPNEGANEAAMRLQRDCKHEPSSQKFLDPNYTYRYPRLKKWNTDLVKHI